MNNLIVTIISIALIAVAAIMGLYYGGIAFQNGQAQAWANAMISQNQQLIAAANVWSLNHGGDIWSNVGISDLVNQGFLSEWPNLVMTSPQPNNGNIATGVYDSGCPNINGYQGNIDRLLCTVNGQNFVNLRLLLNDPYNGTCNANNAGNSYGFEDARYAKHPYVQLALAINKITGAVPTSATIAGSGLPYFPAGGSSPLTCFPKGGLTSGRTFYDASGNLLSNYCILSATPGTTQVAVIYCTFTQ